MLRVVGLLLSISLSLSAIASETRIRLATVAPDGTPWADAVKVIEEKIKVSSQGKMNVRAFLGGQLGGEIEILQGVRRGRIEGAGLTSGALGSVIPELNVLEFPFLFSSAAEVDFVLDNYLFEPFQEIFEEKGLILVSWSENGWRNMAHKSKPILSPADVKGVKIRSQESQVHLKFWNRLGANPIAIAIPEVLSSLQTGMVEGFDNTALFTLAAEWHTAVKHYSVTEHIFQPAAIVYSKRFYDGLKPEDQKIVMLDANEMAGPMRDGVRALSDELTGVLKESGVEVHVLSAEQLGNFRKAVEGLDAELVKELGGKSQQIYALVLKGKEAYRQQSVKQAVKQTEGAKI